MKDVFLLLDLDGTLIDDGSISKSNKESIRMVVDKDIPIVPATTRMRFSASRLLKDINISQNPMICHNGARVVSPGWDKSKGYSDWRNSKLDLETAAKVSEFADDKNYELTTVFSEKKFWRERKTEKFGSEEKNEITYLVDTNEEALEHGKPISFMMHRERNGLDGLKGLERFLLGELKDRTTIHRHHRKNRWTALTIYPPGISKETGLDLVCERLDVSRNDAVAVGDDEVDMEIIKNAGIGIAVENSPKQVKEVADVVAPPCSEEGVSWVIDNYIL